MYNQNPCTLYLCRCSRAPRIIKTNNYDKETNTSNAKPVKTTDNKGDKQKSGVQKEGSRTAKRDSGTAEAK